MPKPIRTHPKCRDLGCQSYNHLVCPVQCELITEPRPEDDEVINGIPRSVLTLAPTIALT